MATDNPKIQGYIQPNLHQRFVSWKKERGINKDSLALNVLFREFFGEAVSSAPAPSTDRLEALEEKVASIVHQLQALAQTVESIQSTGALLGDSHQTTTEEAADSAESGSRLPENQGGIPSGELDRTQGNNESLSNLLAELPLPQSEIPSQLESATMPTDIGVGREADAEETKALSIEAVGDERRIDAPLSSAPSETTASSDLEDESPNELLEIGLRAEATSSDLRSKSSDELLVAAIQGEEAAASSLPNESLREQDITGVRAEQKGKSELLTVTELANLLGIGARAVGIAAEKGNDYFREWSAKKGKGIWDFKVLNPGSKKPRRMFFKVI